MSHLVYSLPIEIQDKIFSYVYRDRYNKVIKEYIYSPQRIRMLNRIRKRGTIEYLKRLNEELEYIKDRLLRWVYKNWFLFVKKIKLNFWLCLI